MNVSSREVPCRGKRIFFTNEAGLEVAHAYVYFAHNDLHNRPFAFVEDVMVDKSCRGQGIGKQLMQEVIEWAKQLNCYKIVACSRHSRTPVHKFYTDLGFADNGREFKMVLE